VSNDAPITTSAAVSGNTRNVSSVSRPTNRWRTRAIATKLPSTTATIVDSVAISRLLAMALVNSGYRNGSVQASKLN
jgi:hypothetical protein